MAENKKNHIQLLKNFFRIGIDSKDKQKQVAPTEPKDKEKFDISSQFSPVKFPDRIQKLFNYFVQSTTDRADSIKNRFQRYKDLSFMRYNSPVVGRAIKMYAFETTQADAQNNIINVITKDDKLTKYIYKFLNDVGISEQLITDVAYNLALYGDSFWINSIENNRITAVTPISVFDVKDRLEFNASRVYEEMQKKSAMFTRAINRQRSLQLLADLLNEENLDYAKYFQTYLFGFVLNEDLVLPPWGVTHFRLFSTESEFYPYGRPLVMESLAPFRNLKSLEVLQQMARTMNFPTEVFEVKKDENMTGSDTWDAINEARMNYLNLNLLTEADKEDNSIGRMIWTHEGLLTYSQNSAGIRLDDIADIELAKEDLVGSTDIPISFLIPDKGSFGNSGISLVQQYKPLARTVYMIQSAILEEISNLIKMQFLLTNEYPVETNFELEMRYPVLEETSDRQRAKSDNVRFITDLISTISDSAGLDRNEKLPPKIILDIFSKYSFIDTQDLIFWFDQITGENPKEENESAILSESLQKKISRINEATVMEAYFLKSKEHNLYEGTRNGKHYLSSSYVNKNKKHNQILEHLTPEYENKLQEKIDKRDKNT